MQAKTAQIIQSNRENAFFVKNTHFLTFDKSCQNSPIPLHRESRSIELKPIYNMMAILIIIGLLANLLNYICGGNSNMFK